MRRDEGGYEDKMLTPRRGTKRPPRADEKRPATGYDAKRRAARERALAGEDEGRR
jgi:hypothetical protein